MADRDRPEPSATLGPALDELDSTLGPGAVLRDPADHGRYTEPFRGTRGSTPAVVRPDSVEAVRAVVGWAQRHRVRLLPQGANSGLVGASTPPPGGVDPGGRPVVVVSLERLDEEPAIDPIDRTAVVTAGTRLSRLQDAAAIHGLTFPIDLGADPSLGGMVSTNTGGARMVRHGDVRRHVLGVRAVVADREQNVVDELTTLRKHNVGPSLTQLFVGSSGAFGIVTHVALDLDRLPASRACAWVEPPDAAAALEVLLHLERNHAGWLEAFEVVSAEALDAALAHGATVHPFGDRPAPPVSVLVELAGDRGAEDRLVGALAELSDAGVVTDAVVVGPDRAWLPRHAVSEGLRQLGTVLGFDISVPRPALPPFLERVRAAVHVLEPDAVVADFGHWGDGGVHCNVVFPGRDAVDDSTRARVREVVLGTAVHEFGGSFSAEHGVGPTNADWWIATASPASRELTAGLKGLFDPDGVLGHPGLPYGSDPEG